VWGPDEWFAATRRNARSVQTLVGWIFWDPGAVARYERLGLPGPLGYIAARAAPLASAGPSAVIAAFGSISPAAIRAAFALVEASTDFGHLWAARDEAVLEGLEAHAPAAMAPLARFGEVLWPVVVRLPTVGRALFGAHLDMARPEDPVLSGWHAVNCLREWRGDTHWALVAAHGLTGVEASILHNEWLGYEPDWIPVSRGTERSDLDAGWAALEARGLARGRRATPPALALRQEIEDETDRLTTLPWELLGIEATERFAEEFEPPCTRLLHRVDVTAGPNYQPASRLRERDPTS